MKLKIIYDNGTNEKAVHQLAKEPLEEEEALILCRRICMEGFYKEDGDIGQFIPPARIINVTLVKKSSIIPGQGLS